MKQRDETVETTVLPGNRTGRGPESYPLRYVEGPRTEDAGRDGRIGGRSRWFMHNPG